MKPFYQSKTLWANLAMAIAAFFPQVSQNLDPEAMVGILAAVNAILRFASKEGIVLK